MNDPEIVKTPEAPYGYKKDGTPKNPPGRPVVNPRPSNIPASAQAEAPLRRNNTRLRPREDSREASRDPSRANARVVGRDGEELTRRNTNKGIDPFERHGAPPEGWTYQWNPVSALNKEVDEIQKDFSIGFNENGWRPVPSSRYPGIYHPKNYEGAIVHKGQRLEERPLSLTEEARYEDQLKARRQTRDQTDALRLTQSQLPGAKVAQSRNVNGIAMNIDARLDAEVPRPSHMTDDFDLGE